MPSNRAQSADRSSSNYRSWCESSGSSSASVTNYDQKLSSKIVSRIRKLSPAALRWRRRSSDQHKFMHDHTSFNNSSSNTPLPCSKRSRSHSTSDLKAAVLNSFSKADQSLILGSADETSLCETRLDDSVVTTSWSLGDIVELQVPDSNVWQLRHQFPKTFVDLLLSYMRNPDLSMEEIDTLCQQLKEISEAEDLSYSSRDKFILTRRRKRQANDSWFVVVNVMLLYLLEGDRYSKKFILRRPGNQIYINELETQLNALMKEGKKNPMLEISDVNAVLASYDVSVIACTLSRILRRNGPIFTDVVKRLLVQLSQGRNESLSSADWCRTHRKSVRLVLLLLSRRMRNLVLRPLFRLFAKIACDPVCEVEESSLAILFTPVFFIEASQQASDPRSMTDKTLTQTAQRLIHLCRHELECQGSVNSLFKLPKLFLKDIQRNLAANKLAKSQADEPPPLYSSMTYCINITQNSPAKNVAASRALPVPHISQILSLDLEKSCTDSSSSAHSLHDSVSSSVFDVFGRLIEHRLINFFAKQDKLSWSQPAESGDAEGLSMSPRFDAFCKYTLRRPTSISAVTHSPIFDSRVKPLKACWEPLFGSKRPVSASAGACAKRPSLKASSCVSLQSNKENAAPPSPVLNASKEPVGLDLYHTPTPKTNLVDSAMNFRVRRRPSFANRDKEASTTSNDIPSPVLGGRQQQAVVPKKRVLADTINLVPRLPDRVHCLVFMKDHNRKANRYLLPNK
ncbi:hypothetical protein Ciccas_004240 [Cichlidogyrus casuarinus]|uniref:Rho-GAP domain-containing protein n=1 Tax=Cichlidogyrus casuarinus TaxID=1844966 RepID=A0ABD2QFH3_9PLAT